MYVYYRIASRRQYSVELFKRVCGKWLRLQVLRKSNEDWNEQTLSHTQTHSRTTQWNERIKE